MIIKVDYPISLQEMYDILTGAFEDDAIDYWAETKDYTRDSDMDIIEWKILEYDERDGKEHKYTLTINTIEKGIRRILNPDFEVDPSIKQWILSKDMDSSCYDYIIQAGLFGELVYG